MVKPKKSRNKQKNIFKKQKMQMRELKVEILWISSNFNRLFLPPFAKLSSYLCTPSVANIAFSSNLPIHFQNLRGCLKCKIWDNLFLY